MELAPVSTRRVVAGRRARWVAGLRGLAVPALLLLALAALVAALPLLLGLDSRVDAAGTVRVERTVPTSDLDPGDLVTRALPGGGGEAVERVVVLEPGYVVTRSDVEPDALPTRSMVVEHPTMPLILASVPHVGRPLTDVAPGSVLLWCAGLGLVSLLLATRPRPRPRTARRLPPRARRWRPATLAGPLAGSLAGSLAGPLAAPRAAALVPAAAPVDAAPARFGA